ncbi:MAG: hypothetical protein DCF22_23465 [Leptolyngbya sp.]|nr:MAG: hypothetical protein DCF22_23465 [Leptolyngbya sp.]
MQPFNTSLSETLKARRERLSRLVDFPIALWSGRSNARNFPANTYPFRASSHFLYFGGLPLENAVIRLEQGKLTLFMDDASPASALWHGESPTRDAIAQQIGANAAYPLAELAAKVSNCATVLVQDLATRLEQAQVLNRAIAPAPQAYPLGRSI